MTTLLPENAVELRIADLKNRFVSGSFEYDDPNSSWRQAVDCEFPKHSPKVYGVYILRHRETRNILYIGRAGEIIAAGQFKNQDLPLRLKNTREGDITANKWFSELVKKEGPIIVEYIVLNPIDTPIRIEKQLLDCHYQIFRRNPNWNKNRPI